MKLLKFIIYAETPSKKNSRINTKSGRSFPSKKYTEWHKQASESILLQLKNYGFENKKLYFSEKKTIVIENENHTYLKIKPNYNYNYNLNDNVNYNLNVNDNDNLNKNVNLNDNDNYFITLPLNKTNSINLTFTHGDLRRRDSDNATSSIFDLLQDVGILSDDNYFVIPKFSVKNEYKKNNSSCLIEIMLDEK